MDIDKSAGAVNYRLPGETWEQFVNRCSPQPGWLLDERGKTHGQFEHGAAKALELQQATQPAEQETAVMMFARQMICAKLARIVCGDPNFADHWIDVAGYATLVANSLKES